MSNVFMFLMAIVAIFLVMLVLVQRGRGGGLAGALGGAGGSSAFGAKAGDVFTKITVVTAAIWIILCAGALAYHGRSLDDLDVEADAPPARVGAAADEKSDKPADGEAPSRPSDPGSDS